LWTGIAPLSDQSRIVLGCTPSSFAASLRESHSSVIVYIQTSQVLKTCEVSLLWDQKCQRRQNQTHKTSFELNLERLTPYLFKFGIVFDLFFCIAKFTQTA
jgi:hypothetical protein